MRITGLWRYPVKGCRGTALAEAPLCTTGIRGDREFVIVDEKGVFITQRDYPQLARIDVFYRGETLVLAADGHGELAVPLSRPSSDSKVQVWSTHGIADDVGDDAAAWLRSVLGKPLRLTRATSRWQRSFTVEDRTLPLAFVDGYPLLLISEASLADLNTRLPAPVPMTRFRPNIVVDGLDAYSEDRLMTAVCDSIVLRGVKPCTRCAVTTTDQTTGERDARSEPLRTLARYRNDKQLRGVKFGMNVAIFAGDDGTLTVGNTFRVALRGED